MNSTGTTPPPLTSQTLLLPNARTLGFAEYGSPTGPALIYLHGFPSSRLDAILLDAPARRLDIRVIAPDRPGFGLSSPQPHRGIATYPASDIAALAAHLRLPRFAVLGLSGGGPYALACAAALPPGMLTGVGVMAGAPPWEAGPGQALPARVGGMSVARRATALASVWTPSVLRVAADAVVGVARWVVRTEAVAGRIDAWLEGNKREVEAGGEVVTTEQRRERLVRVLLDEPFAQGAGGMVQEARLLSRDWGFRFEDVRFEGVKVWHGVRDTNAPVEMVRYMVERMPQAMLKEYDDDHYSMARHVEEILRDLMLRDLAPQMAPGSHETTE